MTTDFYQTNPDAVYRTKSDKICLWNSKQLLPF